LRIANHGKPIPADVLETLFDPFKPSSTHNRRNPGGLGLGLYIVSEIVKGHEGTINVRYHEGQIIFEIVLPRH